MYSNNNDVYDDDNFIHLKKKTMCDKLLLFFHESVATVKPSICPFFGVGETQIK